MWSALPRHERPLHPVGTGRIISIPDGVGEFLLRFFSGGTAGLMPRKDIIYGAALTCCPEGADGGREKIRVMLMPAAYRTTGYV